MARPTKFMDGWVKTCPRCGGEFWGETPEDLEEFFGSNAQRAGGLQVWCRMCRKRRRDDDNEKDGS